MTRIPQNALVVVADGGKALFLRAKTGHGDGPVTLEQIEKMVEGDLSLQGPSGARPREDNVGENSEASFANHIAKTIDAMANGGKAADIVIAADPQTLGQIRDALGKNAAGRIAFTLAKDLTNHSMSDIAKALH